jgi:hypothetical protein
MSTREMPEAGWREVFAHLVVEGAGPHHKNLLPLHPRKVEPAETFRPLVFVVVTRTDGNNVILHGVSQKPRRREAGVPTSKRAT